MSDQGHRLHRIVEMLLFLARADTEAALPGLATTDLRPWLEEHLRGWAAHPRASDIRPFSEDAAELLAAAHLPLLGQIVDILLDNACKYSPPGSPVTVSLQGEAGYVLLIVEDEGCGIDPEDRTRVFEPFFRSARRQLTETDGVGLGLSIAHRIATAMGGGIEIESIAGNGSRFTVRLNRGLR